MIELFGLIVYTIHRDPHSTTFLDILMHIILIYIILKHIVHIILKHIIHIILLLLYCYYYTQRSELIRSDAY